MPTDVTLETLTLDAVHCSLFTLHNLRAFSYQYCMAKAQIGWIHFNFTFFEWTENVKCKTKNEWMASGTWHFILTFLCQIVLIRCRVQIYWVPSLRIVCVRFSFHHHWNPLPLTGCCFVFSLIYAISGWESFMIEFLWNNSIVLNSKPSLWCMSNVR